MLCLLGIASPGFAAFFQQTEEDTGQESVEQSSPIAVKIQGAKGDLKTNLEAFMPTLRTLKCDSATERVDFFREAAEEKLQQGAQAMGYYSAQINMTPKQENGCWVLHVAVQAGKPVRIAELDIQIVGEGVDEDGFKKLESELPYDIGEVFVHQPYEDYKSKLTSRANNLGFFDAKYVKRRVEVDPVIRQAKVKLHFDTGPRYKIGAVRVDQDKEILADKYLKRHLRLKANEGYYDTAELLKQQRILEGSEYYREVQVLGRYQEADKENHTIPVDIIARNRKRYSYTGKIGYGTDTGLRSELSMDIHWVNNKGHKLKTLGVLSKQDQRLGGAYKVPLWEPEHEHAVASVEWYHSDNGDIKGRGLGLGLDYNRRTESEWDQTLFIEYVDETTQADGEEAIDSQLTLVGARVKRTKRDDLLFPTKGWQVDAEVKGAHESLLSDQDLLQAKVRGKYLHTLDNKNKLIMQGQVGTTITGDLNEMPKSLRFFAGGQNSVRGYAFESLGETDADGDVIGAKHLLTASVEYEHIVKDNWSAAAFVDTGNAFNEWDDIGAEVGAGVGVRYKSPLGPVRADLASPLDNPSDVHFYFSLGPDL